VALRSRSERQPAAHVMPRATRSASPLNSPNEH